MKVAKMDVQKAYEHARSLLYKLRTDGCCDSFDPLFLAALEVLRFQRGQKCHGRAHQIITAFIGDVLLEPNVDQLTRLKKTVDALTQMNSRQHVLIAYQHVIQL